MNPQTRKMLPTDWPTVSSIYAEGQRTGNATFQNDIPTWEEWNAAHIENCRIVATLDDQIAGWAALTPVSGRCVYAGVAEVSVYVGEAFRGQKIGLQLLQELVAESEKNGYWTLQAGIFPENESSVRIHEKCGFRQVGRRERIGQMAGIWRDTLLLERRSSTVGVPHD